MATLTTRIGQRDDPKRSVVILDPGGCGSYLGVSVRPESEDEIRSVYGNTLDEAIRQVFWWRGIKLYTLFDLVEDLASAMAEAESEEGVE